MPGWGPMACALTGVSPGAVTPKPTQHLPAAQAVSRSPPSNLSSSCCLRGSGGQEEKGTTEDEMAGWHH